MTNELLGTLAFVGKVYPMTYSDPPNSTHSPTRRREFTCNENRSEIVRRIGTIFGDDGEVAHRLIPEDLNPTQNCTEAVIVYICDSHRYHPSTGYEATGPYNIGTDLGDIRTILDVHNFTIETIIGVSVRGTGPKLAHYGLLTNIPLYFKPGLETRDKVLQGKSLKAVPKPDRLFLREVDALEARHFSLSLPDCRAYETPELPSPKITVKGQYTFNFY